MQTVVICVNGDLPSRAAARTILPAEAVFIAADGGVRHCAALSLRPRLLIGDMDSAPETEIVRLRAQGVEIRRFPSEKDETDLELALTAALAFAPERIMILGALGGRLDQTLGNLALLTDARLQGIDVRLDDGVEEAFFIVRAADIHGQPGDLVSLLPWGADVHGVCTEGLRWTLRGETLYARQTRGVSNVLTGRSARVTVSEGRLLCVHTRRK